MPRTSSSGRRLWPLLIAALAVTAFLVGGAIERASDAPAAAPAAPHDLVAVAATCAPPTCAAVSSRVTLDWAPSGAGGAAQGYAVLRDGAAIPGVRLLPAGTTEFVDRTVAPGSRHTYAVAASNDAGTATSPQVPASVPLPPIASAHLDGVYRVSLVVRAAVNLASLEGITHPAPGVDGRSEWIFTVRCAAPDACVAHWRGRAGAIRPRGSVWAGTVTGLPAPCLHHPPARAPVRLRIVALGGAMKGGEWVISRFRGTSSVRFHCPGFVPSHGTVAVTGTAR